jgi:hypothetical protein
MLIPVVESSLVSVSVLGQTMIVIDTIEMAIELLDRRSAIYSSRYIYDYGIIIIMLTVLAGQVFLCSI